MSGGTGLGHHGGVGAPVRFTAVLCLGVTATAVGAGTASAATRCVPMTLKSNGVGVALEPSSVTVDAGACVALGNGTALTATFTVGGHSQQVASGDHWNYAARAAGTTQKVTASELLGSAHGSIVIRPAAQPSTSPAPSPGHTSTPQPQQSQPPAPGGSRPGATPAATSAPVPVPSASPPPPGSAVTPAPGSSPFLAGRPTPSPSSSHVTVVGGPLQPPTGRGTGLPAAVAALAAVATAGALLRVLLAEPVGAVDGRRSVGAAL